MVMWLPFCPALRDTPLFLEIGSFYNSPRVKHLGFTVFESIQPIFWYVEEYQWQFLVSLTTIIYIFSYNSSQWDQKLSGYWYSSKYLKIGWMDSEKVKHNCLNSGEVVKLAYLQKKWSIPLTAAVYLVRQHTRWLQLQCGLPSGPAQQPSGLSRVGDISRVFKWATSILSVSSPSPRHLKRARQWLWLTANWPLHPSCCWGFSFLVAHMWPNHNLSATQPYAPTHLTKAVEPHWCVNAVSVATVPYGIPPTAKHNICPTTRHPHNTHRKVMTVNTMQPIQITYRRFKFYSINASDLIQQRNKRLSIMWMLD